MGYTFDTGKMITGCVEWIRTFFAENGPDCQAVIGISGGKDSSVAAALLKEALGAGRILGVLMPCGTQTDIDMAEKLVDVLGIESLEINIKDAVDAVFGALKGKLEISEQTRINLPPRIRMSVLYAVSQSRNGRVVNTCNLSEDWVGYSTRYGDAAGDLSPLSGFTVTEVKAIGRELGLPEDLVNKVPSDGLCGKTDEDSLGFTYAQLDRYLRENIVPEPEIREKIDRLHKKNLFKLSMMPAFQPEGLKIYGGENRNKKI